MTTGTTFEVPPTPTGVYTIAIGGSGGGGGILSSITTPPVPYVDHPITGETIIVEHAVLVSDLIDAPYGFKDQMKQVLVKKLVDEMFKKGYIEFTQMEKHETKERLFRARIHAVPDTQVRLIRELKNAK